MRNFTAGERTPTLGLVVDHRKLGKGSSRHLSSQVGELVVLQDGSDRLARSESGPCVCCGYPGLLGAVVWPGDICSSLLARAREYGEIAHYGDHDRSTSVSRSTLVLAAERCWTPQLQRAHEHRVDPE